jgi:hypothetical protein
VLLGGRIGVAETSTTAINVIASKTQFRFKAIDPKTLVFSPFRKYLALLPQKRNFRFLFLNHRRLVVAKSRSPPLALRRLLTRLFYFMPLLRPASVSHIRSEDTKRGGSDQEVRTRKKFARKSEPNAN